MEITHLANGLKLHVLAVAEYIYVICSSACAHITSRNLSGKTGARTLCGWKWRQLFVMVFSSSRSTHIKHLCTVNDVGDASQLILVLYLCYCELFADKDDNF